MSDKWGWVSDRCRILSDEMSAIGVCELMGIGCRMMSLCFVGLFIGYVKTVWGDQSRAYII